MSTTTFTTPVVDVIVVMEGPRTQNQQLANEIKYLPMFIQGMIGIVFLQLFLILSRE
jgi:hypothetical protein